jgi:hypothetical protein
VLVDANGNADVCIQRVAPITGPDAAFPGWHCRLDSVVVRNANICNVLAGDVHLRASVSGDTFTAAGHELANDDVMNFIPILRSTVLPGSAIRDQAYHVVSASGNTFKLSLTQGGSPVTFSDSGAGPWLLARKDRGDCTLSVGIGVEYGNISAPCTLLAHIIQASDNTFEASELASNFVGNMQLPSSFTSDAAANTITTSLQVFDGGSLRAPVVGDVLLVMPNSVFGGDILPAGLTRDTEYWVKTVSGSGPYVMTLSLTQGGSTVDITGSMTGTCSCVALANPYYGLFLELGTVNVDKCVAAGLYADVCVRPRPASTGFAGRFAFHSESWRVLDVDTSDVTMTGQIGSVDLNGVSHLDIFNGDQESILWCASLFTSLTVNGGSFNGGLTTKAPTGTPAPVTLNGPVFWNGTRQPGVTDPLGSVRGSWFSNGVPVSRTVGAAMTFCYQPTSTLATDIMSIDGTGTTPNIIARLNVLKEIGFELDCTAAGFIALFAKAGSDGDQPASVYADADGGFYHRNSSHSPLLSIRNPSGSNERILSVAGALSVDAAAALTVGDTTATSVTISRSGVWTGIADGLSVGGSIRSSGATLDLGISGSGGTSLIQITNSGGPLITTTLAGIALANPGGTNHYVQIKCADAGGHDDLGVFIDARAINLRDESSGQHGNITYPSGNVRLSSVSALKFEAGTSYELKAAGAVKMSIDGSGNAAFGATSPSLPFGTTLAGVKSGGTALANLITLLANFGVLVDGTS